MSPVIAKMLFAVGLMELASGALAASFDCNKARSDIEKLICKDPQASALDGELQQAYKTAQAATDAVGQKALREEQRHWISYTRDLCTEGACLRQAYTTRIAVLARNEKDIVNVTSCEVPHDGKNCVNVVTYRDPSIRLGSFNQSLTRAKQAGKLVGCSRLINLPVGIAGSNNSFGGICTLQKTAQRKVVEICDDDMFGHFEMRPINPQDVSDKALFDFTYRHCFGG